MLRSYQLIVMLLNFILTKYIIRSDTWMGTIKNTLWKQKLDQLLHKFFSGETMNYKQIIAIIIPIVVDQGFLVIMSLLNTAMISSSGVAAVSAVSMVDSLNIFLINVFVAIATGGTVIVAQYKGSGNQERVARSASQTISAVTGLSLIITACILAFHTPILNGLFGQAEEAVFQNAKLYLIGSCLSYPLIAMFQAINGVLRGMAETKTCLALSLIMNITYLLLNVLLVVWLDMGVMGLIISMLISRALGMATSLYYLTRINHSLQFKLKQLLHLDRSILAKIMFIGFPFALEQMFFNGGKLLTQTFIVKLGTAAMTINAISGSISMVFQIVGSALSIAIVTVVGQCIGRKNIKDARKFIKSLLGLSTVVFILVGIVLMPFFSYIVAIFSPPKEIISSIYALTLLIVFAQPFLWSLSFVLPAALRAAGDSRFTSVTSLISMWLFRIIFGYILGITLGFGLMGVWIAMVAEWGIRGAIFGWRFRGEKWYQHKII